MWSAGACSRRSPLVLSGACSSQSLVTPFLLALPLRDPKSLSGI